MFLDEILEEKYNDTFKKVYTDLKYQKESDDTYTIDKLKALLESLYINEGNDWLGRGDIKDTVNKATIAACQKLLAEWESE
ncbi:MAG: hypothetical protein FH753_04215 [Firmicutes bacterium]|nr:hypothetical protein [Bacillota bacterium]MTI71331.1 hypothetical protein [Bacillota bacterium]